MSRGTGGQDAGTGADQAVTFTFPHGTEVTVDGNGAVLSGSRATQPPSPEMPARQPYADLCTRVYTRTGKKAHLLPPQVSPNTHGLALCGTGPEWFELWRGTGSQKESELAASLPVCKYCEKRAKAADEADSRLAGYGRLERAS